MNKLYLSFFALSLSVFTFAQEACDNPSKKVLKVIAEALKSKDTRSAVGKFNAAIEMDEENAKAYYEYGVYAYNNAMNFYETKPNPSMGGRSLQKSEELFRVVLDLCPDYHANASYYLGVINYMQQEMPEAIKWFKAFKNYNHSDVNRYPEDFTKKLTDVNDVLTDLENDLVLKSNQVPFAPQLVRNVSTSNNEYFPMISPDNELIFYTRKLDRSDLGSIRSNVLEEITFSARASIKSSFDGGSPLSKPFNDGSVQSYGAATLSVDNKEMIICACKSEQIYGQAYMNCDLYSTTFKRSGTGGNDFQWTELKNMGRKINTPDGWEGQPSLSADGNTLFYTVNRSTSRSNDIYIVERTPDGEWGVPRAFDEVNTDGKDKSPFLHQDSETLYFVSESTQDRHGVGGLDIFYIRNEDGVWTAPKNIGYPINSESDELGLFVSIDGEVAYYSSHVGGNWNIYSFELYEEARPKSVAILKGELKDELGGAVENATIEIAYEGSGEVTQVKVNGDDGRYAAIVKTEKKQDVMVTVKKEGHAFTSKVISKELFEKDEVSIEGKDLTVKELKLGESYTINDVLYATNSAVMNDRSKFILQGFARFLHQNPTLNVLIQGHTDDVGDAAENLVLSTDRAEGVRAYLVSLGIYGSRLSAKGYGKTMPKFRNDSSASRAKNRRTDFVIEGM